MKDKIKSFLYDIYCSHIYHCSDSMLSRVFVENCKKNHINPFQKVEGEEKYIEFWRKAFGKRKVDVYSYRLFSHYMGCVPYIIPEVIGYTLLEKHLNPLRYRDFYSDKNAYSMYFPIPGVMPKTLMCRVCGGAILTYNEEKKQSKMVFPKEMISTLSSETISQVMEGYDKICVKPAVDTCSGVGVNLFQRKGKKFVSGDGVCLDGIYLKNLGDDWVVQEVIAQHPYMSQFNESSINTLRICVYRSVLDEQPKVTGALMRIGANGAFVDNAHAGGRFAGVDVKTGKLHHTTLDQYGTKENVWNGVDYSKADYQIPHWEEIKKLAVRIADCNIHCRLLAFDLCLDSAGNPRVIELNVGMFSWWLFLFIAQDVFAGKTQAVIDYCLEKEKQFHPHLRLM